MRQMDTSQREAIAELKRILELWMLDRAFHEAYLADPDRALKETRLEVDPRAAALLLRNGSLNGLLRRDRDEAELPEAFVGFRQIIGQRLERKALAARELCVPKDPRFRDWRERQLRRYLREFGGRGQFLEHHPVVFELSSGCSVGCPFCALSTEKLKGVFRHTPENAALWLDILKRLHTLIGDAAGRGMCYYASEPLDNPDYELFLQDYYEEFGTVPQTTTAASTRNIERTRSLLSWGQAAYPHFDRISVLSEEMRDVLFSDFTPEELLFTDLLPQFPEAPAFNLVRAGRSFDTVAGDGNTIACASGFVINMAEGSVRLLTPVAADREHPTGERIYEIRSFSDGSELENEVRQMIDRHMRRTISLKDVFSEPQAKAEESQ